MSEGRAERNQPQQINVDTVVQSIRETEEWWNEFQPIAMQPRGQDFIRGALALYEELEKAALNPQAHFPKTADEAVKIKALWVISAPGTYFKPRKEDRYKDKKWSQWNDRQRINHAFEIGRKLVEVKSGHPISHNWVEAEREINAQGPLVVYNGTPEEDEAVLEAIKTPWLRIPEDKAYPKNKVYVINPIAAIGNTVNQIHSFRLPKEFKIESGDEIGLVIHAPQAVRFLYMLNNFPQVIPKGVTLRVFPLPTPVTGIPEYLLQELRGLINYGFIANPPLAAGSPFPYQV